MKSEPISIRVDDTLVSTLKEEARRLSYEGKRDILYTDLIRNAVQEFATKIEKDAIIADCGNEILDQSAPLSSVLANRNTVLDALSSVLSPEMSEEEWLSMFGFLRNRLSTALQQQARPIVDSLSLPRAVLEQDAWGPGKSYERDVCGMVYIISRRGAIPDIIQEGETYLMPTFQIAYNPGLRMDKILSKDIQNLANLSLKSATGIAKEETSNFCALLEAAATNRGESIHVAETITLDALSRGYDLLVTHGLTPRHLIISPTMFTKLSREAGSKKGKWSFGMLRTDNGSRGMYQDANIRVTDRMWGEPECAYFVADNAGYFVEKQPVTALMNPNPPKLQGNIVMWTEIGMSISADYMVSCVTTKAKE